MTQHAARLDASGDFISELKQLSQAIIVGPYYQKSYGKDIFAAMGDAYGATFVENLRPILQPLFDKEGEMMELALGKEFQERKGKVPYNIHGDEDAAPKAVLRKKYGKLIDAIFSLLEIYDGSLTIEKQPQRKNPDDEPVIGSSMGFKRAKRATAKDIQALIDYGKHKPAHGEVAVTQISAFARDNAMDLAMLKDMLAQVEAKEATSGNIEQGTPADWFAAAKARQK